MRARHLLLLIVAFAAVAPLCVAQAPDPTSFSTSFSLDQLRWMSGSWRTRHGASIVEEHWTEPQAGTMIGMGRTIAGQKTVFYEYLRIESRPDGVFYVAHPKARPGTDFKLVRSTATEVVFENTEHDFPKRIIYRLISEISITARVEGDAGDEEKVEEFHYVRMK